MILNPPSQQGLLVSSRPRVLPVHHASRPSQAPSRTLRRRVVRSFHRPAVPLSGFNPGGQRSECLRPITWSYTTISTAPSQQLLCRRAEPPEISEPLRSGPINHHINQAPNIAWLEVLVKTRGRKGREIDHPRAEARTAERMNMRQAVESGCIDDAY
jgi:hypothetical protein